MALGSVFGTLLAYVPTGALKFVLGAVLMASAARTRISITGEASSPNASSPACRYSGLDQNLAKEISRLCDGDRGV